MKRLIWLPILLLVVSCGARKVHKEEVKIVEKEEVSMMVRDTSSFHTDISHNTITSIDIEEDEIIITPIDTAKEMKVENKTYKNVVIKRSKKKDRTRTEVKDTTNIDSTASHTERAISLNIMEGTMSMKSSEKEDGQSFYLWSFLFLLLLILLIFLANKFKQYLF
jgi:hypothetical protein